MAFNKPIAVLISDVHYSLKTLELADASMRKAINSANGLNVPVIVAGDLHDTKANLRAECVNAMIETFDTAETLVYIIRGNHDSINEKSQEHSLNFLRPYVHNIIADYLPFNENTALIAYQNDAVSLKKLLKNIPKGATVIMHQGLSGSNSGEYIQDKTAIACKDVAGIRVISGHYHTRQTIKLPKGGKWDYIGNPYTLNYAEANDPEKGYQILYSDGNLEFVPTNLRKHALLELEGSNLDLIQGTPIDLVNPEDIVKVRIIGSKEQLVKWTKDAVSKETGLKSFSLELLPTKSELKAPKKTKTKPELLDSMIDDLTDVTEDRKNTLKDLWKSL